MYMQQSRSRILVYSLAAAPIYLVVAFLYIILTRSCVTSYGAFQRGYVCPVSCCPSIPAAETGSSNTQVDGKGYQHVKLILLGSPFFCYLFQKHTTFSKHCWKVALSLFGTNVAATLWQRFTKYISCGNENE